MHPLAFFLPFHEMSAVLFRFAGRKEGSGRQVFPANGLKTEPRGNRGFWLLVGTAVVAILDIGCFLPGREWMGLDLGRFVLGTMR